MFSEAARLRRPTPARHRHVRPLLGTIALVLGVATLLAGPASAAGPTSLDAERSQRSDVLGPVVALLAAVTDLLTTASTAADPAPDPAMAPSAAPMPGGPAGETAVVAGGEDGPSTNLPVDARAAAIDAAITHEGECREAGDGDVPTVVAAVFRCNLHRAGFDVASREHATAEAVVVSRCESLWDAHAVVFDGRYRDWAHPGTGNRYSAAGVFQFIRATADDWIDGGYAMVTDARRNIDAAARLYLHNRARGYAGWEDWACAAANDGFKVGSVLPGWPGGPATMPAWALAF